MSGQAKLISLISGIGFSGVGPLCLIAHVNDYQTRFGGVGRLFGTAGLERLRASHVAVVGIGGVGVWAVEALARSGVGELTLIDLDDLCVTNINRQLHALDGTIGTAKVDAMAARARSINPDIRLNVIQQFFTSENAATLLANGFDHLIDAIDNVENKCLLLAECRKRKIPALTCGGAGGLRTGLGLMVSDLAHTSHDGLLRHVRKSLRKNHGFPTDPKTPFDITAVFSNATPVYPWTDGSVCDTREAGSELKLDCSSGFGTAAFVTGAMGLAAAEHVVSRIARSGD